MSLACYWHSWKHFVVVEIRPALKQKSRKQIVSIKSNHFTLDNNFLSCLIGQFVFSEQTLFFWIHILCMYIALSLMRKILLCMHIPLYSLTSYKILALYFLWLQGQETYKILNSKFLLVFFSFPVVLASIWSLPHYFSLLVCVFG